MADQDLKGKTFLVTGANSGIGKVTATELAAMNAQVVMLCRNRKRAEQARDEIVHQTNNTDVFILLADLSDQRQIFGVAREFCRMFEKLDVLINNAGIIDHGKTITPDGLERTLAINHLGAFLLTNLLKKPLQHADAARIVTVSSEAHKFADLDMNDLQLEHGYYPLKAYANSKLCNILFTKALDKRLQQNRSDITANCLHPGAVATKFGDKGSIWFKLIWFLSKPFLISPEKGAETMLYLATDDSVKNRSGEYFKNCKISEVSGSAANETLAEQLWQRSIEMTSSELDDDHLF